MPSIPNSAKNAISARNCPKPSSSVPPSPDEADIPSPSPPKGRNEDDILEGIFTPSQASQHLSPGQINTQYDHDGDHHLVEQLLVSSNHPETDTYTTSHSLAPVTKTLYVHAPVAWYERTSTHIIGIVLLMILAVGLVEIYDKLRRCWRRSRVGMLRLSDREDDHEREEDKRRKRRERQGLRGRDNPGFFDLDDIDDEEEEEEERDEGE